MLFRSAWERRQIQVEEYEIRSRKVTKDRCFVFLTDLHGNQFGDRQKKLLAAITAGGGGSVQISDSSGAFAAVS